MRKLGLLLALLFALSIASTAAASDYPSRDLADRAMAAYTKIPCGDSGTYTCGNVSASNMLCNDTFSDSYRVCQGYYTEHSVFYGDRYCYLKYPTRVQKTAPQVMRVAYWDDTCYAGYVTPNWYFYG